MDEKGSPEKDLDAEGWIQPAEINFDPQLYSDERIKIYTMICVTLIMLGLFFTIYMIARLFV